MRLARVRLDDQVFAVEVTGAEGAELVHVLDLAGDDPLLDLIRSADGSPLAQAAERVRTERTHALSEVRLLAPIARPGKIVAIGLNYLDHTAETGLVAPRSPLVFAKHTTSVAGPYDDIRAPRSQTAQVDYEGELVAVVGATCAADGSATQKAVTAYTAGNDVSARDVQFGDGQWTRGKSFDTFAPIGPWLVTADEMGALDDVRIRTRVNGETVQDDVAGSMVFDLPRLLGHLSDGTTLEPGDLIMTGTPAGAGAFLEPPRFLADGDVVEVVVDRVGTLRNTVRDV